ncbi:MAG TPA: hypothetical protein DDW52_11335 [Planctomycetaceae bacterium]|nr:hypothetical protein [Planctomycetaceae bacterium]
MKQPISSLSFLLPVVIFGVLVNTLHAGAPRPNVLYLYVDDMGWGAIGPNGQHNRRERGLPHVKTPNLDRLAREGVNFARGYGCHVCSPARSSQQSGFHQGHTFADRNDPDNAKKAMRRDDVLIGDVLKAAGYATGYWGKWGYGGSKSQTAPEIVNVQTLPTSHGYQEILAELHHVRAHTFFQPTLWRQSTAKEARGGLGLIANSRQRLRAAAYPSGPAMQHNDRYPKNAYCDDSYAVAAYEFVRAQSQEFRRTGQPFFGLLACQIPHAPFAEIATLPDWDVEYRDEPWFSALQPQSQQWAAMVTRIDAHIGNLLAILDDPNGDGDDTDSIANDTIVIFQSDNGGPGGASLKELATNGHLSGVKGMIQEGGIRVPLLVRWPKHIRAGAALQPGSTSQRVVDVTDWLPTFAELAGAEAPLGIDGVSIAPTLTGTGNQRERPYLIHEAGNSASIIAGRYKLVATTAKPGKKRKQPARKSTDPPRRFSLYDLELDPGEKHNVAAEFPDLVKKLAVELEAEHVYEPRGFAATYHRMSGSRSSSAVDFGDAENWSEYVYENAGVEYTREAGKPKSHWIARIDGSNAASAAAPAMEVLVKEDQAVLALAIAGEGTVVKVQKATLMARNELRVTENAALKLDGGIIESKRWVEIADGGLLEGNGVIRGNLQLAGRASLGDIEVIGDLELSPTAKLSLNRKTLEFPGTLRLDGHLEIPESFTEVSIRARQVSGNFSSISSTGTEASSADEFVVSCSPTEVVVKRVVN